ncbi:hypothetical protein CSKR_109670 [Clonorchis sinensis]|uniref:Clathrin light chain n=1 Tax=Clonorchis sinensis TaxID=79923 RepID=A0A8T1MGX3_CLOSI|nr:hypothetical protein CSKR_109670 [Clonorchis sinensis]
MSEFDPVSDFLSREQEALGELSGELDLNLPDKTEDPFSSNFPPLNQTNGGEFVMLNGDANNQTHSTSVPTIDQHGDDVFAPGTHNGFAPGVSVESSVANGFRTQTSISDTWCEDFNKRIAQKDAEEEKKLAELQASGAYDLENWYKHYRQQNQIRSAELRQKQSEAESGEQRPSNGPKPTVTDSKMWDQVCGMCDFQDKQKPATDLSRMRGILLSLKSST